MRLRAGGAAVAGNTLGKPAAELTARHPGRCYLGYARRQQQSETHLIIDAKG